MLQAAPAVARRLWAIQAQTLSGRRSGFSQERKRSKKKEPSEGEACGNCAAVEIDQGGLRQRLLDDFHRCLKKACAKTAPAFFTVPHRPDRD
jgi:hypothetical protein